MENSETNFVTIIKEICEEQSIQLTSLGGDWGFLLKKGEKKGHIVGYQFGLNTAVSAELCSDKSMASELLAAEGVPCVPHHCFMAPHMFQYVGGNGNWEKLERLLEQYGTMVCKDNRGTGGREVYLVRSQKELEQAADRIFDRADAMAVSPYCEIRREYRVILLDQEVMVVFLKIRQHLTGDGRQSIRHLYADYLAEGGTGQAIIEKKDLERVLGVGEEYPLNWKHNLGQGAYAQVLSEEATKDICDLARQAAECLGIRFASVDVADTAKGIRVLEVNSGVMMENLAGMSREYRQLAKSIYERAIFKML